MLQVKDMTIEAGIGIGDITPPVGTPMDGYGARREVSTGVHDPLYARSLVLSDGVSQLVLCTCDLVGVTRELVDRARDLIGRRHGIAASNICITASHTHSGPSVLYTDRLSDYISDSAERIATTVDAAMSTLTPVTLKLTTVNVRSISQNRRNPDLPIEEKATILLADRKAPEPPLATVLNYACHATILEADNLLLSTDFPGAAVGLVERLVGGNCLYLQGACGDINPAWMRHDFDEVARVGGILGAAAARAVHELRPVGSGQWAVNLSWSELTEKSSTGSAVTDPSIAAASATVELTARELQPLAELNDEIAEAEGRLRELDEPRRRRVMSRLNQLRMEVSMQTYPRLRPRPTEIVEVQAFRLGKNCALLALPGEFLVGTAHRLQKEADIEHLLFACYANDYIGYVPPQDEFVNGGYEVGFARFAEGSESVIRETAVRLLESVTGVRK
jgi:Neutral/alkaline non-lysosomal ceramidase, N-terminal